VNSAADGASYVGGGMSNINIAEVRNSITGVGRCFLSPSTYDCRLSFAGPLRRTPPPVDRKHPPTGPEYAR
jgi:hypothetical protein